MASLGCERARFVLVALAVQVGALWEASRLGCGMSGGAQAAWVRRTAPRSVLFALYTVARWKWVTRVRDIRSQASLRCRGVFGEWK